MTPVDFRMLFMPREAFPTDRVRINVLFRRELCLRGHRIDLVMQAANENVRVGPGDWVGGELLLGRTDTRSGAWHRLRKLWLAFWHDARALLAADPDRYEIVLISDKFLIAALGVDLVRRRGQKFIYWLTFPYPEAEMYAARTRIARFPLISRLRGWLYGRLLYKWILPRSDHIFVQSEKMKDEVAAHGIAKERMTTVLTGFDPTAIRPLSRAAERREGAAVNLAYLGTLSANRQLTILLDMLAILRAGGVPAHLLFIGDAERPRDRALLENHAKALQVAEYMQITGSLSHSQAMNRISSADIALSPVPLTPVLRVGSPTKLVEYLALGLPVIANDHPEQRIVLQESRAGVLVPWGARHFARAARWIMNRSPQERVAMGVNGRTWVEQHRTYARIADDMEAACRSLF